MGGVNCAYFHNGECLSHMANGERWQNYWGLNNTIACPFELPFGTVIIIDEKEYTCRDRGGLIVKIENGFFWVDILTDEPLYPFGTVKEAHVILE